MDDDIALVARFDDAIEANIMKGVLEANGVTAAVMGDSTANTLLKTLSQGDYRLVVRQADLQLARKILATAPPSASDPQ